MRRPLGGDISDASINSALLPLKKPNTMRRLLNDCDLTSTSVENAAVQHTMIMEVNSSSSEEDTFESDSMEAIGIINNQMAMCVAMCGPQPSPEDTADHRTLQRGERQEFQQCAEALRCINRDYLGPKPQFNGRQFNAMFRISTTHFQCIMEDFARSGC